MNKRERLMFESNNQCYYCGCPVDTTTKYCPDSACINLYLARKHGGGHAPGNEVVSCFLCCTVIKKDLDVRKFSVAAVRKHINLERKRLGKPYNALYANSDATVVEQFWAAPKLGSPLVIDEVPSHSTKVEPFSTSLDGTSAGDADSDSSAEDVAEARRLQMLNAQLAEENLKRFIK